MKNYLKIDPWNIIEEGFHPELNRISESIFSIGNGHMGQRANFEEDYSGDTLKGSYMAGVYYPDKTKVGWWKNGYPEYFAKVVNSTNWIGINIEINNEKLDLNKCSILDFKRILNMKEGYLERIFTVEPCNGNKILVQCKRFVSIVYPEVGVIKYSITPLNFSGKIKVSPYLDGDIANEDSNYNEKFWEGIEQKSHAYEGYITMKTKKLDFYLCSAMKFDIYYNNSKIVVPVELQEKEKFIGNTSILDVQKNDTITIYKYVSNVTSRDYDKNELSIKAQSIVNKAYDQGFHLLLNKQSSAWQSKWEKSDIVINGDDSAQQAIRFNIFQLNQTYTGEDSRLNIGPKGFTGEKYGGSTYWDTEAYCIPFYLSTSNKEISKNLLIYRYNQLPKAKENAKKLGLKKGALFPMVTMNGEECHNEWEITFEEVHRNGAIAYAIYNYVNYTGDISYLRDYGLKVLIEISRFWEERANFSLDKNKYVILGVTGPNEYENNVNNNWYTNRIAVWTLEYTLKVIKYLREEENENFEKLRDELSIKKEELEKWQLMVHNMYFPEDISRGIFLQQDGFLDKDLTLLAKDLNPNELPLNQHWSWDRILRSPFIKQADVLQGLYFLQHEYDLNTVKRNFDFYEPLTVHESSLSSCVHSILASKLGYKDKAYELYLRTARLDLDDYNNDTRDGCHITSMAGTWMSIVHGFAGMSVENHKLILKPYVPNKWNYYSFNIIFNDVILSVQVNKEIIIVNNEGANSVDTIIFDKEYLIRGNASIKVNY